MADRSISVYLRAQVADFKRQMDEAGKSTKKVGEEAEKAGSTATTGLGRLTESATKNRESWDRAGTTLTAFGAGTVAALGYAAKAAVDWESAWAGVAKTVDGTDAELAAIEDGLRELARTLPASHQEIAAVAEAAGQLGVATGDIVSFTRTMIDLSETTNLSADEAATSIAQMMNVMQTAPEDVDNLGASLVALGNNGASTERDIIQMAQRIAGAGKIVGLTEGEVMGLANALASTGIEVEAGGSAISNIMIDISKAVSAGGADLESWAKVAGMSASDFAAAWKSDPADALTLMVEGLGRMNAAGGDVFATLSDLGQTDIRVTRALLSMANSGDLLRKSLELGNSAWEDNTALAIEAAKRYDTTEAKLQVARNSINDAAITLGETFLPAIAGAADAVASLAQSFGGLPAPVQTLIGGLGGLAGVVTLLAGGFLLTFPRVIETVRAFRELSSMSPRLASNLGRLGKAAGGASAAIAALAVGDAISTALSGTAASVEMTTSALLDLDGAGSAGAQSLDEIFASLSRWDYGITGLQDAIDRLVNPSNFERINNVAGEILSFGGKEGSAARQSVIDQFDAIGTSLASLVQSGNGERAAEIYNEIAAAWENSGGKVDDLNSLLPAYQDSLAAVDNEQQLTGESATDAAAGMTDLAQATAAADEELQNWIKDTAASDASFIDILGAYDDLIQKNKDVAQATADSTESSKDSWETYYDGVTFSLDEYLAKLDEQVAAQQNWEQNLILLSGRASQGVIDNLASMGPEGAPLVQALLDGTDEQLSQFEASIGQSFDNYTTSWANNLHDAAPVITAASAQLGADAAKEIAAKLSDGTTTIEDVIRDYGLVLGANPLEVPLDTELTLDQLAGLVEAIDSASGTLTMMGDTGPAGQSLEDVVAQVNESDGTVTIYGADGQAISTLSNYKATVDSTTGAVTIDGWDDKGRATVVNFKNWVPTQGASVPIDADTSAAQARMRALQNLANALGKGLAPPPGGATGGAVSDIAGFASGGRIPGTPPADPMQDNLLAMVDGHTPIAVRSGEFIEPQPAVDYYGLDVMHAIRGRRIPRELLQGYAVGGALNRGVSATSPGASVSLVPQVTVSGGVSGADLAAAFDGMSMTLVTEAGPIRAIARTEALSVAGAQRGSRPRS